MGLRPTAAHWFEVLTPCDDLARAVEAMAATGLVQVEAEHSIDRPVDEPGNEIAELRTLARRHQPHWPKPDFHGRMAPGAPRAILVDAITAIRAWAERAEPLLLRKERIGAERAELSLLGELAESSESALSELGRMADAGPRLEARLLLVERGQPIPDLPKVIVRVTPTKEHVFLSVLASRSDVVSLESALEQSGVRRLAIPKEATSEGIQARLEASRAELGGIEQELTELSNEYQLPKRLADVQRLEWFLTHVPPLDRTRHFALVTGWTSDPSGSELRRALDEAGVNALLRLPSSPAEPPIIFSNPPWAKPFETLAKLLGTPSPVEADPSVLLVVLAPVLFGFMFADVGHGALLSLAGFLLRRRIPALAMLIPGGVAAMFFGFCFGSLFGREDIVPALWLHPLAEPLRVLAASVVLGAGILVLGLLLSGLEAHWRRRFSHWLLSDGALALCYVGVLVTFVHRAGLWVAAAGAAIHVLGPALVARQRRVKAAFVAAGELIERALQLGVNTVSFARVGAFALAHAGLCVALVELEHAAGRAGGVVVFLLGNAIVLLLEGLVVGIQTTRLVLFEFFARFLRAEGRAFIPLVPPASDEAMTGAHK